MTPFSTIVLAVGLWFIAWLGKDSIKSAIVQALQALKPAGSQLQTGIHNTKQDAKAGFQYVSTTAIASVKSALEVLLEAFLEKLDALSQLARRGYYHVIDQIAHDRTYTASKILGVMIEFILLLLFIYADLAISVNNIARSDPGSNLIGLLPPELVKYVNNKTIALVMSSTGSAFAMGLILGDLLGLTHFGSWGELKGFSSYKGVSRLKGVSKWMVIVMVLLNFALVLSLSIVQGMGILRGSDALSASSRAVYQFYELFAQGLIIIPLLIATLLLFRGIYGILILTLPLFGGIYFFLRIAYAFIYFLNKSIALGAVTASGLTRILGFLVGKSFGMLSVIVLSLGGMVVTVIHTAEHLVDILAKPIQLLWDGLTRKRVP